MELEINIATILEDKPKDTKLYTPIIGDCELMEVYADGLHQQHIIVYNEADSVSFTDKGKLYSSGECLLFPSKQMQDWNKFAWKRGDVLGFANVIVIFDSWAKDDYTKFKAAFECNQGIEYGEGNDYYTSEFDKVSSDTAQKFIKNVETHFGGKLNPETLGIEKPKPQFKNGDILTLDEDGTFAKVTLILKELNKNFYSAHAFYNVTGQFVELDSILTDKRKNFHLATEEEKQQLFNALAKEGKRWNSKTKQIEDLQKHKREIWNHPKKCEFKAFDRVLVRDIPDEMWMPNFFSNYGRDTDEFKYGCIAGNSDSVIYSKYCIPYNEETAHLLGTTDDWEGGEGWK